MTARFRHLATSITAAEPLFLVMALVCLVLLPLRFAPIGLGLMAVAWVVRWLATGRFGVRSPADWSLVVLLVMVPVTLYVTPLPEVTWRPDCWRSVAWYSGPITSDGWGWLAGA